MSELNCQLLYLTAVEKRSRVERAIPLSSTVVAVDNLSTASAGSYVMLILKSAVNLATF